MTQHLTRRSILSFGALAAAGGGLAACSSSTKKAAPSPSVSPTPTTPPSALDESELADLLTELNKALTTADEKKDPKLLSPIVAGSALAERTASYEIMKKVGEETLKADPDRAPKLSRPDDAVKIGIATDAQGGARYALAVADAENGEGLPFFVGFEQQEDASDSSRFVSWGWARQLANVKMPTVAPIPTGSEAAAVDDAELLMSPKDAIALYCRVLTDGHDNADKDDVVATDPFLEENHAEIQTERKQINEGVDWDQIAQVREEYTPNEQEYLGIRTVDGGAIVMTTLTSNRRLSVSSGQVEYGADTVLAKLVGRHTFTKELVRTYGSTIALHIPAKDQTGEKIQPIAGYKVLLKASGS
ncbi:hypothetical protein MHY20_04130 [Helcobacillus sp. ACRRO]|uniref:hypothetical protein n=1 Tax=Helcobacillus sp. ACRRO TaxID=2918202 RepID=UPI001EF58A8C|nr:hypothetical protein [Helcobacillus sp. ACRRO]MCG7426805.1 hypothetical protein [Helcobacillus sp. ACRRO]